MPEVSPRFLMILRQYLHTDPVAVSCLFGCPADGAEAVVDPIGDIAPHLDAAQRAGMRVHYVVDTHLNANHLSAGMAAVAG
jgi:hydroxyacylglutathione hydrolase